MLFSFNFDFFVVEGLSLRGAKNSCGIMSMACLNLPVDIRYKPENMYLAGIIPGPDEPHLTEVNHYVAPVVDVMHESWVNGIHLSHTALHPEGRLSRSAIACAVCDLLGARKVAQMGGANSNHVCTVCKCYGKKEGLDRTHEATWEKRGPSLSSSIC